MCDCGGSQSIQQYNSQGKPGVDGLSAYEIARKLGYVGTEQQWIDSLAGAAGEDGTDGTDGTNGTNGTNGAPGVNAFTFLDPGTTAFTMPAVNATIDLPLVNASWVGNGQWLHMVNAGTLRAVSVSGNTVTLRNPGVADGAEFTAGLAGNATAGSTINNTTLKVSPAGRPGTAGVAGPTGPTGGTGLPGLTGLTGSPGSQIYTLAGDPNGQPSSYGAPNGSIAIDTSTPNTLRYYQRTAPGVWNLFATIAGGGSGGSSSSDIFRVRKQAAQPLLVGSTTPTVINFENQAAPYFNGGAWNGSTYLAGIDAPNPQNFTLENFIIARSAGPNQVIAFLVEMMQDTGGGPAMVASATLSMGSTDTRKSFAVMAEAALAVTPGSTVWIQVTPSVAPTAQWSVNGGSLFYNQSVAPPA